MKATQMIKRFVKSALILALLTSILYAVFPKGFIVFQNEGKDFFLPVYMAGVSVFVLILLVELISRAFTGMVNLLKNDVLVSNHAFAGDKETLDVISSGTGSKIVLSRNQFDEAAILIVKTMSNITSGLMNEARRQLVNLRNIIGDDAIIDILMLKIYKGEKNFDKMEQLSQKLMQNEDIQLVGMKAALEAQMEKKEFTEALKTVNQAFEVRQDLYWVIGSAFLLRAKNNDWLGALEVLDAGIEKNIMPEQKASRLRAVALYELAKQAKENNEQTKFFKFITQALSENSKLVPAALDLADYYVKYDKQTRKAEKILYSAWVENPHYETAQAYLSLFPKDTKAEKIQRMEKLALSNSIRPSLNNLILAELYISAKKFSKAKTECRLFLLKNPATQKMAAILREIEQNSNRKSKRADSLVQSIKQHLSSSEKEKDIESCPKDFQWVCANCGHTAESWQAICPECGEIGRSYWHLYIDKTTGLNEEE